MDIRDRNAGTSPYSAALNDVRCNGISFHGHEASSWLLLLLITHHICCCWAPIYLYICCCCVRSTWYRYDTHAKISHGQSSTDRIHNHISSSIGLPVHQSCWTIHPVPIMSHKILQSRVLLSYFAINWMQNLHRLLSSKFASIVIVTSLPTTRFIAPHPV